MELENAKQVISSAKEQAQPVLMFAIGMPKKQERFIIEINEESFSHTDAIGDSLAKTKTLFLDVKLASIINGEYSRVHTRKRFNYYKLEQFQKTNEDQEKKDPGKKLRPLTFNKTKTKKKRRP